MDWAREARWARGPGPLGPGAQAPAPPRPSPSRGTNNLRSFSSFFFLMTPPKIMKKQLFGHSLKPRALGTPPGCKSAKFCSG